MIQLQQPTNGVQQPPAQQQPQQPQMNIYGEQILQMPPMIPNGNPLQDISDFGNDPASRALLSFDNLTNAVYTGVVDSAGNYRQDLPPQQPQQPQVPQYPQQYPPMAPQYPQQFAPNQQIQYPPQGYIPQQQPQQQPPGYPEYRFTPPSPEQIAQFQHAQQSAPAYPGGYPQPLSQQQFQQQPVQPFPGQPQHQAPLLTPQQLQELQEFQSIRQTEDYRLAMGLVKTYQTDPKSFVRTYMAKELDEILAEHKLNRAQDPSEFASDYAEGKLTKEFGVDFEFDPAESRTKGTPSYQYDLRRQALMMEGMTMYQHRVSQEQNQRTQETLQNERAMLGRLQAAGIAPTMAEQFKKAIDQIPYNPETYWDMVVSYAEKRGVLNGLRAAMPHNPQLSFIPQPQQSQFAPQSWPQPQQQQPFPQQGPYYPQQQPQPQVLAYPPYQQPQYQPQMGYIPPQNLPREVQPLPLPGVSQIPGGQGFMSATQQSLAGTFPPGFLEGSDEY